MKLGLTPFPPSWINEGGPDRSATSMLERATLVSAGFVLAMSMTGVAHAEAVRERTALMLSGRDCPAQRQAIIQRFTEAAGVTRIDMSILPDHVMIDRVGDRMTAEDFATLVNEIMAGDGHCHAEVMKSCITADIAQAGVH
jgi:hypothetical protein